MSKLNQNQAQRILRRHSFVEQKVVPLVAGGADHRDYARALRRPFPGPQGEEHHDADERPQEFQLGELSFECSFIYLIF